ncbi:MAG: hypothetical protein WKF93_12385, partial [Acidimicrobiales bacterium]
GAAILAAVQGAVASTASADGPRSDKIEDITEWVGTDIGRAQAALALEKQEKGADARPTLVSKLTEIIGEGDS